MGSPNSSCSTEAHAQFRRPSPLLMEQRAALQEFVALSSQKRVPQVSVWKPKGLPSGSMSWRGSTRRATLLEHVTNAWVCRGEARDYDHRTDWLITMVVDQDAVLYRVQQQLAQWSQHPFYPWAEYARPDFFGAGGRRLDAKSLLGVQGSRASRSYLELSEANAIFPSGSGARSTERADQLAAVVGLAPAHVVGAVG
jgi:hypothetical protein